MPGSDPTQIENDFDLRTIDISTIESIEIIRGAASSLYVSAAATAVIKPPPNDSTTKDCMGRFVRFLAQTTTKRNLVHHQIIKIDNSNFRLGMNSMLALFHCSIKEHWVCHLLLGMRMTLQKTKSRVALSVTTTTSVYC